MTRIRKPDSQETLPSATRGDEAVQGHWLLARRGKRVLRPGGVQLTRTLLAHAGVTNADVLELAPGLGRTAAEIVARQPRSYLGAEQDPDAARAVRHIVSGHRDVRVADAADFDAVPDVDELARGIEVAVARLVTRSKRRKVAHERGGLSLVVSA